MRITRWIIERFQNLKNMDLPELPKNGVTVLCGPNDSGKSNLIGFIKGVLFGFAGLKADPEKGTVLIETPEGVYSIEREGMRRVVITLPNGRKGNEDDLRRLLGGVDYDLFKSLFDISIDDIRTFEGFAKDPFKNKLFSAGTIGVGKNANEILSGLSKRADKEAKLSELLANYKSLLVQLDAARSEAGAYIEKKERLDLIRKNLFELTQKMERFAKAKARQDILIVSWPEWCELQTVRREIDEQLETRAFPEDAEQRLEEINGALRGTRERIHDIILEQRLGFKRLRSMRTPELEQNNAAVEELAHSIPLHKERVARLREAELTIEKSKREFADRLKELPKEWDEEKLAQFLAREIHRSDIRNWDEKFTSRRASLEITKREFLEQKNILDATVRAMSIAKGKKNAFTPPTKEQLREHGEAIVRLRANLATVLTLEEQVRQINVLLEGHEKDLQQIESEETKTLPLSLTLLPWVGSITFTLLASFQLLTNDPKGAIGYGAGSFLLSLFGWGLSRTRRRLDLDRQRKPIRMDEARERINEAKAFLEEKTNDLNESEAAVGRDAVKVGLPSRPSYQQIEEVQGELYHQKTARETWEIAKTEFDDVQKQLDAVEEVFTVKKKNDEEARAAMESLTADWKNFMLSLGLDENIEVNDVLRIIESARMADEALRRRQSAERDVAFIKQAIAAWEEKAAKTVAGESEKISGEDLIDHVVLLRERSARLRNERMAMLNLEEEILKRKVLLKKTKNDLANWTKEHERLLNRMQVLDEKEFRERLKMWAKKQNLIKRAQEIHDQLVLKIGSSPEAALLMEELGKGQLEQWKLESENLQKLLSEAQRTREETLKEIQTIEKDVASLETSNEVARLSTAKNVAHQELKNAVDECRTLAIARGLIEESLKEFEQTHQPTILGEASALFAEATQNRYARILSLPSQSSLAVMEPSGEKRPVEELSRSSRELLNLCIRLSLIDDLSRRTGQSFPVMLEDVLMSCDPARAQSAARMLMRFALKHQVLFLTCHPEIKDIFRDLNQANSRPPFDPTEAAA